METIELQIGLKNYDPQKDKRFNGSIKLPLIPRPKLKVCVLGDVKHCEQVRSACSSSSALRPAARSLPSISSVFLAHCIRPTSEQRFEQWDTPRLCWNVMSGAGRQNPPTLAFLLSAALAASGWLVPAPVAPDLRCCHLKLASMPMNANTRVCAQQPSCMHATPSIACCTNISSQHRIARP